MHFCRTLLLALFIPFFGIGQDLSYHLFDTDKGLPGNEVYDLLCDKNGGIWGATDGGVFHYNGNAFETFSINDGLIDNSVLKIYLDQKSRLWLAGFNGGVCFIKDKKVRSLKCNDLLKAKLKGGIIFSLYVDSKDHLWIGTTNGLFKVNIETHQLSEEKPARVIDKTCQFAINEIKEGGFFASVLGNPNSFNAVRFLFNNQQELLVDVSNPDKFSVNYTIQSFAQLPNGNYLLSCGRNLFEFNQFGIVQTLKFDFFVNSFTIIGNDLWMAISNQGLMVYKDGNLRSQPEYYLKDYSISSFQHDFEGGVWISTIGKGMLYIQNPSIKSFARNAVLNSMSISFCPWVKKMVVLTDMNEVFLLDQQYRNEKLVGRGNKIDKGKIIVAKNNIIASSSGSFVIEPLSKRSKNFTKTGKIISSSDAILLGEEKTVFLNFDKLQIFNGQKHDTTILLPARGQCLFHHKDVVLIGTLNGMYQLKGFEVLPFWPQLFKDLRINAITQYKEFLVVSTMQKGVIVLDNKLNKWYYFDLKEGLPVQAVNYALLRDRELWASSKAGLVKISFDVFPSIKQTFVFDENDGLPSRETSVFTFHDQKLWIATRKGLCIVENISSLINNSKPVISFVTFSDGLHRYHNGTKIPLLNYNENNIEIVFNSSANRNKTNQKFKYRLLGYQQEYKSSATGSIMYSNLPPGFYTLEAFALNNHGISSNPYILTFEIANPLWKRWWFVFICIILGLLFVYLFIKWRIAIAKRIQQRESEIQQILNESRMQAIRAQMNPHFIFNSINSIQGYVLQNKSDEAYHYLTRFSQLIRTVLDNSKEDMLTLQHELDLLALYVELEQLRFSQKFKYEVLLKGQVKPQELPFPVMILQPLVENAIWHGLMPKQGHSQLFIKLEIQIINNELVILIIDNGIGFTKQNEKTLANENKKSLGLQLVRDRLLLLDKSANLSLIPLNASEGTLAKIEIPLNCLYESVAN